MQDIWMPLTTNQVNKWHADDMANVEGFSDIVQQGPMVGMCDNSEFH